MHRLAPAALSLILASAMALGACSQSPQPPGDALVCYHLASVQGGKAQFNVVARAVPDMEHCAADLEAMRIRFLNLGGGQGEIAGAYQGNFLFLQQEGVFTSSSYEGVRYPFLVRTGDGRLAAPGAMPSQ
jgi:hypothetical protein